MAEFRLSDEQFQRASERGSEAREKYPRAVSAKYDRGRGRIVIVFQNGLEVAFSPRDVSGLEDASSDDLRTIEIQGHALHLPKLDADLSIPRILEGFLGPLGWTSRERKATAARANGRLGGRPRKPAVAAAG
jgi:hypothetical protein